MLAKRKARILWLQGQNAFLAATSKYIGVKPSYADAEQQTSPVETTGTAAEENQFQHSLLWEI